MNQATKHKTPWSDGGGPFSIEQVLTDEAWELHGENNETKELEKLAKKEDETVSFFIRQAIKEFLDRRRRQ